MIAKFELLHHMRLSSPCRVTFVTCRKNEYVARGIGVLGISIVGEVLVGRIIQSMADIMKEIE